MHVEAGSPLVRARRYGKARSRLLWRRSAAAVALLAAVGLLVGLAFAGSPAKLASGVRIAGVDVGGMTPSAARAMLERRSGALAEVPVVFTAAGRRFELRPNQLGVEADWVAAVGAARRQGEGFAPFRGFRRLHVRFFGADVAPPTRAYGAALDYELAQLARAIDRAHREAAVVRRGLQIAIVPGQSGRVLDRDAAAEVVVRALAGFARTPVALPLRTDPPRVRAAALAPAAAQARTALSAPVRLALGPTRWRLPRWRIAELLALPKDGARTLKIGGPGANRYFARLQQVVNEPAKDADFAVTGKGVGIVPAVPGRALDVAATAQAVLRAAVSPSDRVAPVVVAEVRPKRTTEDAKAMGITGIVGSYETVYGGIANRIHNVQLVSHLIDDRLIAPGATFSFNQTTGERTAAKGFLEAPVIINGELQTALGGGVCQVSTTVFNAAYEAGLNITARTNHALYIGHYPLARDATVNYPNVDLRFVNDTGHWLLLRTFVGQSSLTVNLYGTPTHRRVESDVSPLVATGAPPAKKIPDPTLLKGKTEVEESGEPSRATSVRRRVYDAHGKLLYENTWYSSYRGEPAVVRVGTKPRPKPEHPTQADSVSDAGGAARQPAPTPLP